MNVPFRRRPGGEREDLVVLPQPHRRILDRVPVRVLYGHDRGRRREHLDPDLRLAVDVLRLGRRVQCQVGVFGVDLDVRPFGHVEELLAVRERLPGLGLAVVADGDVRPADGVLVLVDDDDCDRHLLGRCVLCSRYGPRGRGSGRKADRNDEYCQEWSHLLPN